MRIIFDVKSSTNGFMETRVSDFTTLKTENMGPEIKSFRSGKQDRNNWPGLVERLTRPRTRASFSNRPVKQTWKFLRDLFISSQAKLSLTMVLL